MSNCLLVELQTKILYCRMRSHYNDVKLTDISDKAVKISNTYIHGCMVNVSNNCNYLVIRE
jgi:hypothetical protein